ncbi:Ig-like domain-containing protein [Marinobacter sp. V034]|uniref:Ig-like domain-containing protein n=1 Tax=Marinobacter sp. V034 TaxID=3459610 RepID=UPI0040440070
MLRMKRPLIVFALFGSASLLSGCGDSSDTTPPEVSSVTPAAGMSDVQRDVELTASFNEDMLGTSVNDTTFTVTASNTVTGAVTFNGDTNVATFTPDSDLPLLTEVTASLGTGMTDLVANGLTADYDWSFTTRDGRWGTAELIETDNAGNASTPQIAMDASGNAIAVWHQSDGTHNNIVANRYAAASGWGTAELIETDNAGSAYGPQIATDANGNAIAVWYQQDGTRTNIVANRYAAGSGWGTAELIETDNAGNVFGPQIAMEANGNAIAVWQQHDGTRNNIVANRYAAGSGWGTAELIETDNTGPAYNPQIVIDANGNAIAVWQQYDGTRSNIVANRYEAGSGWGTAELIETDNAGNAARPQIAADANGNAIAVWQQHDGTRENMVANRYTAGSGWGTAELIETDNAGDASRPQIATDANGNAIAVWQQHDGTRENIVANRYTAGSGWGTAELIETDNAGNASTPQIAIDASGNAIAVWHQSDGTRDNIVANRYAAGSGWGMAELIETDDSGDASNPQIATDANGNAIAVWDQIVGGDRNIYTNRFD